jgi:xanthosine utilization system XapX-like protein
MQRKSLGLVALIVVPGLMLGLVFSILLLLAPAKPAAADCGPTVSVSSTAIQRSMATPRSS